MGLLGSVFQRSGPRPARRLEALGYGQEKRMAENTTGADRAKNRRVELVKVELMPV